MARLTGLGSLVVITVVVLAGLRVVHLSVGAAFPETRPGPIAIGRLDDAWRLAGFRPMIPAYHPAVLGAETTNLSVRLSPRPAITAIWDQHEAFLSVTTQQGESRPATSPLAVPMTGVANAWHWFDGSHLHALVRRDGFWIEIETSLGEQDLRRFVDTLSPF